jgi:hypothetical protein
VPVWQIILPIVGGAFVIYTIYENVARQEGAYRHFGWLVLAWLVIGGAIVALAPGLAGRVRKGLATSSA